MTKAKPEQVVPTVEEVKIEGKGKQPKEEIRIITFEQMVLNELQHIHQRLADIDNKLNVNSGDQ